MNYRVVIPSGIKTWIKENATSKTEKEILTRICRYVIYRHLARDTPFEQPVEISSVHFRENIGTHYNTYLKKLKTGGVLLCVKNDAGKETYFYFADSHKTGRSKQYYFNPDLVFTDPAIVEINQKTKQNRSKDKSVRETRRILARLKVSMNTRQLQKYIRNLVSFEYVRERCQINKEIPPGRYELIRVADHDFKVNRNDSRDNYLQLAAKNGLDLILYKNGKCYLDNADSFIWKRVYQTRASYLDSLLRLKEIRKSQNIVCNRNETNQRLDTNITTLASKFFDLLSLDGEPLVQIDLVNSQFVLLAYVLEQSYEYLLQIDHKHFKENYNITGDARRRDTIPQVYLRGNKGKNTLTEYKKDFCTIYVTKLLENYPEKQPLNSSLSSDWSEFIKLTKTGQFYEKAAEHIERSKFNPGNEKADKWDRNRVKVAMFSAAFSAHRYNPTEKQILANYYPTLIQLMNEFKKLWIKKYESLAETDKKEFTRLKEIRGLSDLDDKKAATKLGNAQLAVMLQRIESSLFIDTILNKLLDKDFKVLSKHDSILCKESDLNAVHALIKAELDDFFGIGGYKLKIDRFI